MSESSPKLETLERLYQYLEILTMEELSYMDEEAAWNVLVEAKRNVGGLILFYHGGKEWERIVMQEEAEGKVKGSDRTINSHSRGKKAGDNTRRRDE